MTARTRRIATLIVPVLLLMINPAPAAESQQQKARQILSDTGVKGGLIVHIGCGRFLKRQTVFHHGYGKSCFDPYAPEVAIDRT